MPSLTVAGPRRIYTGLPCYALAGTQRRGPSYHACPCWSSGSDSFIEWPPRYRRSTRTAGAVRCALRCLCARTAVLADAADRCRSAREEHRSSARGDQRGGCGVAEDFCDERSSLRSRNRVASTREVWRHRPDSSPEGVCCELCLHHLLNGTVRRFEQQPRDACVRERRGRPCSSLVAKTTAECSRADRRPPRDDWRREFARGSVPSM